jgi:hypothetical protein
VDYYYVGPAANGGSSCAACPSFAACPPYTTIETLRLRSKTWRLTNRGYPYPCPYPYPYLYAYPYPYPYP